MGEAKKEGTQGIERRGPRHHPDRTPRSSQLDVPRRCDGSWKTPWEKTREKEWAEKKGRQIAETVARKKNTNATPGDPRDWEG